MYTGGGGEGRERGGGITKASVSSAAQVQNILHPMVHWFPRETDASSQSGLFCGTIY